MYYELMIGINSNFIKKMHLKKYPNSMRGGGFGPPKKEKNSHFLKNSQPMGGRGDLERLGWFPNFYRF